MSTSATARASRATSEPKRRSVSAPPLSSRRRKTPPKIGKKVAAPVVPADQGVPLPSLSPVLNPPENLPNITDNVMLGSSTAVAYWEVGPRGRRNPHPNDGCFGGMSWRGYEAFEFLAPLSIDHNITDEVARFWIRCLRNWFDHLAWEANLVTVRGVRCAFFRLKERGLSHGKTLLYLTAFRCLRRRYDASVVRALFDRRHECDSPEALFTLYQRLVHQMRAEGGETLICRQSHYGYSAEEPISLARFKENLRNLAISRVQAHFA